MNKYFANYEQSLALKELGFDEPCFGFYNYKGELKRYMNPDKNWNTLESQLLKNSKITIPDTYTAPLKSQVFEWFRDNRDLEYQIIKSANGNYSAVIHLNTQEYLDKISTLHHACVDEVVDCYSYEEAEDALIDKLIQIVKQQQNDRK